MFTSSGIASKPLTTCLAYGTSKACVNHLCAVLSAEELAISTPTLASSAVSRLSAASPPNGNSSYSARVLAFSVMPGMVDTEMQTELRERYADEFMLAHEASKFRDAWKSGALGHTDQVGAVMAQVVVKAGEELSGRCFRWDSQEVKAIIGQQER